MIDALAEAEIPILALDELLADETKASGVSLTFDDGISTVFEAAMPILRDRKLPAHVFVITQMGRRRQSMARPASGSHAVQAHGLGPAGGNPGCRLPKSKRTPQAIPICGLCPDAQVEADMRRRIRAIERASRPSAALLRLSVRLS